MMKKHSFTLVELLAVLVVMSILMGIAVPAFRSLTKGHAPDRAAREIMGRIAATRAYAISKRVDTALIFMGNEKPNDFPKEYQFSAYRSCEVSYDGTEYTFVRWIKNDTWTTLPEGIMVGLPIAMTTGSNRLLQESGLDLSSGVSSTTIATEKRPKNAESTGNSKAVAISGCDISDIASGTVKMKNAIVFHPSGMLENACNIELREARMVDDSVKELTSDSTKEFYTICVRKTGKCVYYPELQSY